MARRKEDKLRPYRVDYFDVNEMKDNDKALVRSVIVRDVTADAAADQVWPSEDKFIVIIRAYRFYKKLVHKKDVYKAVEDLFTANRAVKVMDLIEDYRAVKAEMPCPKCGIGIDNNGDGDCATCASASYKQMQEVAADPVCPYGYTEENPGTLHDCPIHSSDRSSHTMGMYLSEAAVKAPQVPVMTKEEAGTGPDSPATQVALADLKGMLTHDAHEQAMDTFVPDPTMEYVNIPPVLRFPNASASVCGVPEAAPSTLTYSPHRISDFISPLVGKIAVFLGVGAALVWIVLSVIHCGK